MVGLMRLVVRHEAQRWSRTGGGMPNVTLVTIKLQVGAHWNLSESVGAWASLLETSETARI